MTLLTCANTNQPIRLTEQITNSGEGVIWRTDWSGTLAKCYHTSTPEQIFKLPGRISKLEVMIAHPLQDPNAHQSHISFAFPQSLVKDRQGNSVGFLMPEIKDGVELIDLYSPTVRKRKKLKINWYFLHTVACNLASLIAAVHQKGYVIGDLKPQNILVSDRALPSIIDTDSFQVRHPHTQKLYPCPVGTDGYTPPELIGKDFTLIEQDPHHDNFRLAVLIYQLLFSYHPFGLGDWRGGGDKPERNELIERGIWLESSRELRRNQTLAQQSISTRVQNSIDKLLNRKSSHRLLAHTPLTIPLNIIHPEVQNCFLKCFNDGHNDPKLRPTAKDWYQALDVARNNLQTCSKTSTHVYLNSLNKCYWCQRKAQLKVDIFELSAQVKLTSRVNLIPELNRKIQGLFPTLAALAITISSTTTSVTSKLWQLKSKLYSFLKTYQTVIFFTTTALVFVPIVFFLKPNLQLHITKECSGCHFWFDKFSGTNLREADLSRASLRGAYLKGVNLNWADLSGAYLMGADLNWADLSWADLSWANLIRANLSAAYLKGANLSWANLTGADLSGADLIWTDLSWADLIGANLSRADLSGADLSGANLSRADLSGVNLSGVKIDKETKVDDKWRQVWEIVNQGAEGKDLSGLDLSRANLRGANLRGADLSGANLRGANLRGANLRGADLSGANLSGVKIDRKTKIDDQWRQVWEMVNQGVDDRDLIGVDLNSDYLSKAKIKMY